MTTGAVQAAQLVTALDQLPIYGRKIITGFNCTSGDQRYSNIFHLSFLHYTLFFASKILFLYHRKRLICSLDRPGKGRQRKESVINT
jgi:hypothetical protein